MLELRKVKVVRPAGSGTTGAFVIGAKPKPEVIEGHVRVDEDGPETLSDGRERIIPVHFQSGGWKPISWEEFEEATS